MKKIENKKNSLGLKFCLFALFLILLLVPSMNAEEGFIVPADPPNSEYIIDAKVEVKGNLITMMGAGTISFKNTASYPLSIIALSWSVNSNKSLEVVLDGVPLELLNPQWELSLKTPLFYKLPKELKPNKKVVLDISFNNSYEMDPDIIHMQKWNPTLWWEDIPTRDEYKVKMEVPQGYAMAISGRQNKKGFYENRNVTTSFGIFLAKGRQTEQIEAAGVEITALFDPEGEECAKLCLETAGDVVKFYKDWHGFFPFDFMYIIPGGPQPWGGYPYASGIVVIHGQQQFDKKPLLHWKWITAHELGHQYWGEYVMSKDTPADYTDSWLMIGMGIKADRAYTLYKELGDEKHLSFFNRYREGTINRHDTTADAPKSLKKMQKYDRNNVLIHGKGYSILSALESVVGKETFEKIYIHCLKEYGGKRLGYNDFWGISENISGKNLKWFFDQWVRTPDYLCYQIISQESQKKGDIYLTRLTVERKGDSMPMPIPVKAIFEDGSVQTAVTDRFLNTQIIVFESESKLKEAKLNTDNSLVMLDEPLAMLPADLPDAISQLPYNGEAKKALELYHQAVEFNLDISGHWFKLGMCVFEGGYLEEAFDCFKRMINLKPSKTYHFCALVWLGNVRDAQGKRDEAVKYYKESLSYESGSAMRHDQFKIESSRSWVEKRLKDPYDWSSIIKR